jgi:LuxR family transcriptional regulator, maltose regulon positive regulatory protein
MCHAVARSGTAVGYDVAQGLRGFVARPSLFDLLSGAARVTQLSAPAGSGKTYLLRSWLAEADLSSCTAWVTVGREERDAQAFWLSVLDALRNTDAGSMLVRELTAAPDFDGGSIAARLLEDLDSLETPLWLVIDDAHELQASEAIDQLEELLSRASENLRFVLSTRRDLALGLHRLRLEGELTEIRRADLRFTVDESRALLQAAGVQLSDCSLESLVGRTEGWAAGLRLAALSLVGHPDAERFAAEFSGGERTIAEYLLAEILDRQPPEASRLLLRTSILERVSGPLADRLTGGSSAARILADLEDAGAFVVSLDPQRSWFRYHRLFADLLALELRRTMSDELPALHLSAAEWFAEHDDPAEAIRHAQAAEDWSLASQLLSDHWFGLYLDGRRVTAHELLAGFPAGMVETDAELALVAVADKWTGGSLDEAERYLTLATRESQSVNEDRRERFEVALGAARLFLAQGRNDVTVAAREAERLLLPRDSAGGAFGLDEDLRASVLTSLGMAETWTGRSEDAERHLEQGLVLARRIGRPMLELVALAHWALATALRSPALGAERSRQAIELARSNGWADERPVGAAYVTLGAIALWRGHLEDADQWLGRADNALRTGQEPATEVILHVHRALLEVVRGRHEDALAAVHTMERSGGLLLTHSKAPLLRATLLITQVRIGQTDRVERALADLDDQTRDALEIRVAAAALHLAQGRPDVATEALAPALEDPDGPVNQGRWAIQALALGAIALEAMRDTGGASRALERALDLAEPDGLLLPFLLFPAPDLLERHLRFRTAHASLVSEILELLAGRTPSGRQEAAEPLPEQLSDSELRVLRYLSTNLQAPEIAGELFVSVNTIRTHMRHVYAKLDVHRRADAVQRARDLGLLAPSSRKQ